MNFENYIIKETNATSNEHLFLGVNLKIKGQVILYVTKNTLKIKKRLDKLKELNETSL